jgi:arsenite methyltransferase
MAGSCPIGFDVDHLRSRVRDTYERVAREPGSSFHFRTGLAYAAETLLYRREELEALPRACTERFAGVGNPHRIAAIAPGATVLDHACGAGMDLLLAARRVGPQGRAIGVDLTPVMREHAAAAAAAAGLADRVEVRDGTFEDLPVDDASVDYVISNGVVNLAPDKARVFREIARVLKPGGQLLLADVILSRELAPSARGNAELWVACVGGALTIPELIALVAAAGLEGGRIVERFECFRGTVVERKLGKSMQVCGVNFTAHRSDSNRARIAAV